MPVVLGLVLGRVRIDGHPAHRVLHAIRAIAAIVTIAVITMMMIGVTVLVFVMPVTRRVLRVRTPAAGLRDGLGGRLGLSGAAGLRLGGSLGRRL
jgi:hypothetical protein